MTKKKITVVLGASPKTERISNQAVAELKDAGYRVVPVHPLAEEIQGLAVSASLSEISEPVDTLTVYLNSARSSDLQEEIVALKPRRVIFNPGAENPALQSLLSSAGVEVENACTLVLLRTGQF